MHRDRSRDFWLAVSRFMQELEVDSESGAQHRLGGRIRPSARQEGAGGLWPRVWSTAGARGRVWEGASGFYREGH